MIDQLYKLALPQPHLGLRKHLPTRQPKRSNPPA